MKTFEERLAEAIMCANTSYKKEHPEQKFKRGQFVQVASQMPSHMQNFPSNFIGIIEYIYFQKHLGESHRDYSLIVLNHNLMPINSISWYNESLLTLVSNNIEFGIELINWYYRNKRK